MWVGHSRRAARRATENSIVMKSILKQTRPDVMVLANSGLRESSRLQLPISTMGPHQAGSLRRYQSIPGEKGFPTENPACELLSEYKNRNNDIREVEEPGPRIDSFQKFLHVHSFRDALTTDQVKNFTIGFPHFYTF